MAGVLVEEPHDCQALRNHRWRRPCRCCARCESTERACRRCPRCGGSRIRSSSSVGHCSASAATTRTPGCRFLRKSPAAMVPALPVALIQPLKRRLRVFPVQARNDFLYDPAGDVVVPDGISELIELIEDHAIGPRAADLPALVVDLLDVSFPAGRGDDFGADCSEPVESLARHLLGQNRDRGAAEQGRIECSAPAVVSRRGPDRLLGCRIKLPGDKAGHQAAKCRPDFVSSRGKMPPNQTDDACGDTGQGRRKLQPVAVVETTALGDWFVLPGDAKKVRRIHVVDPDFCESLANLGRNSCGVLELCEGWNGNPSLAAAPDGFLQNTLVDLAIRDHGMA